MFEFYGFPCDFFQKSKWKCFIQNIMHLLRILLFIYITHPKIKMYLFHKVPSILHQTLCSSCSFGKWSEFWLQGRTLNALPIKKINNKMFFIFYFGSEFRFDPGFNRTWSQLKAGCTCTCIHFIFPLFMLHNLILFTVGNTPIIHGLTL